MATDKLTHTVLIKYKGRHRPVQFIGDECAANEWCMENAGMQNYSWKALNYHSWEAGSGYVIYYFKDPLVAMMFKLVWDNK